MVTLPSRDKDAPPLPDRLGRIWSYLGTRSMSVFPVTWKVEPCGKWLEKVTRRPDFQVSAKPERKGVCEFMSLVLLIPL